MNIRNALRITAVVWMAAGCSAAESTALRTPEATVSTPASTPAAATTMPAATAPAGLVIHLTAIVKPGAPPGPGRLIWNQIELQAPAEEPFHISYVNLTPDFHNFVVVDAAGDELYRSPDAIGKRVWDVPALAAGAYQFVCTIHASAMTGTLTVE